jgi:mono/diheme cytochrome c family protein
MLPHVRRKAGMCRRTLHLRPAAAYACEKFAAAAWEDDHMTRSARMSPAGFVAALPLLLAVAQQPAWAQSDQRTLGLRLFNQSCRVCHT